MENINKTWGEEVVAAEKSLISWLDNIISEAQKAVDFSKKNGVVNPGVVQTCTEEVATIEQLANVVSDGAIDEITIDEIPIDEITIDYEYAKNLAHVITYITGYRYYQIINKFDEVKGNWGLFKKPEDETKPNYRIELIKAVLKKHIHYATKSENYSPDNNPVAGRYDRGFRDTNTIDYFRVVEQYDKLINVINLLEKHYKEVIDIKNNTAKEFEYSFILDKDGRSPVMLKRHEMNVPTRAKVNDNDTNYKNNTNYNYKYTIKDVFEYKDPEDTLLSNYNQYNSEVDIKKRVKNVVEGAGSIIIGLVVFAIAFVGFFPAMAVDLFDTLMGSPLCKASRYSVLEGVYTACTVGCGLTGSGAKSVYHNVLTAVKPKTTLSSWVEKTNFFSSRGGNNKTRKRNTKMNKKTHKRYDRGAKKTHTKSAKKTHTKATKKTHTKSVKKTHTKATKKTHTKAAKKTHTKSAKRRSE